MRPAPPTETTAEVFARAEAVLGEAHTLVEELRATLDRSQATVRMCAASRERAARHRPGPAGP